MLQASANSRSIRRSRAETGGSWRRSGRAVDGEVWLRRVQVPLFAAAKCVRRQVLDLPLGQALRNADQEDRRIRYPVFAISRARPIRDLSSAKCVAFDLTALITLDYLG